MFSYKYYTFDGLHDTNVGVISEACKNEIPDKWNQEQIESNIAKLGLYCDQDGNKSNVKTNYFLMSEYVKFYYD